MAYAKSTPNEIPDCAIPLLFVTGVEETPYGHAGTGFLAALDNEVFLVTAGHCIEEDQHDSLVVPVSDSTNEVARLRSFFSDAIDPNDGEPIDIAFFSIDSDDKNISKLRERAIHLPLSFTFEDILQKAAKVRANVPVIAVGFPLIGTATELDYADQHFRPQGVRLLADYVETWKTDPNCHRLRFRPDSPITNPNGMSGSPVFGFTKYEGKLSYFHVGMLFLSVFPIGTLLSVRAIRDVLRAGIEKERSSR
jgi:hypothetical protein